MPVGSDGLDLHVALVEPDIPFNTGAVARLCVATGSTLHLVGRRGFHLDDRRVKRAGLDYWEHVVLCEHADFDECRRSLPTAPLFFFSAHATQCYTDADFPPHALLVFGSETRGLPKSLLRDPSQCWTIPILDHRVRSLNVAMAAAIVVYEAIRQQRCRLRCIAPGPVTAPASNPQAVLPSTAAYRRSADACGD